MGFFYKNKLIFVLLLLLKLQSFVVYYVESRKCGIGTCHKTDPTKINVHLIPHTHDDVGWLKTVDQYYYGSNKGHAPFGVQYILDSVVSELQKNKARRFVYVESSFFWRWWQEQDEDYKEIVRQLVVEGRLEFLHGGWCMSDEATPHYSSLIDQMTFGLKFLNETFGECGRPLVAWQIDPFGHSSEVALEFAEMGFNGLFVSRIDYEDIKARKQSKQMEMIWRPEPSLGKSGEIFLGVLYQNYGAPSGFCFDVYCSDDPIMDNKQLHDYNADVKVGEVGDLFTGVLYDLYTAPSGFCFDTYCSDEPIMDNKRLHDYNVDYKVSKFLEHVANYSRVYKTNHVIITMGGDFTYSVASSWFKNIDKLIKYVNAKDGHVNLLYSTPSCYLNSLHESNTVFPVKDDDDFFPYGSDEHSYWTGYFTSRAALKYLVYRTNNLLQAIKQIGVADMKDDLKEEELILKRAVAISQHHDGVSGTEKQHVADDYAVYIHEGINASQTIITKLYRSYLNSSEQYFCNFVNISQCTITENTSNFIISVYNPLVHNVSTVIRVPVSHNQFKVYNYEGNEIPYDLIKIPDEVLRVPGRNSSAIYDLIFLVDNVPRLGATTFYVEQSAPSAVSVVTPNTPILSAQEPLVVGSGRIKLTFNRTTGLLQSVNKNGVEWMLQQNFYFYEAMKGYNYNPESRASGAYIFRPTKTEPQPINETATLTIYEGKHVFEVHQKFSNWISQVIRVYENKQEIEFQWLVGPIPVLEWIGKEVVSRYITNLQTNGTFYTDSNGRRWMKRVRNYRKYWNLTLKEPVSSNYYPITTAASIKDSSRQLTVLTDRPQGGTSIVDGQLELMLHRRLLYDDSFGVVEPLDETAFGEGLVVRGTHTVQLNSIEDAAKEHRKAAKQICYSPIVTYATAATTSAVWIQNKNKIFTFISKEAPTLPQNVHMLTLERWQPDTILIRLEHIFQNGEDSKLSVPVTVQLQNLFSTFSINNCEELTLAANLPKKDLNRIKWRHEGQMTIDKTANQYKDSINNNEITIQLLPMQIKTYVCKIIYKNVF